MWYCFILKLKYDAELKNDKMRKNLCAQQTLPKNRICFELKYLCRFPHKERRYTDEISKIDNQIIKKDNELVISLYKQY